MDGWASGLGRRDPVGCRVKATGPDASANLEEDQKSRAAAACPMRRHGTADPRERPGAALLRGHATRDQSDIDLPGRSPSKTTIRAARGQTAGGLRRTVSVKPAGRSKAAKDAMNPMSVAVA